MPYLLLTGDWRRWREFRLPTGILLFLAIAAPWHILAGLRNPGAGHPTGNIPTPGNVHGFFYFYFINEQVLRFLGKRYPVDYNKLPFLLYWSLHLVWLFPWSIYLPVVSQAGVDDPNPMDSRAATAPLFCGCARCSFSARSTWLLAIYAAVILIFFSLSTNQEYYTFPVYFPLLLLTAGALAKRGRRSRASKQMAHRGPGATCLYWCGRRRRARVRPVVLTRPALWQRHWRASRPSRRGRLYALDVSLVRSHRAVFCRAALARGAGCRRASCWVRSIAWVLRRQRHHFEATVSVAFTSAVFLIAAHIALVRFEPMLSSRAMADTINRIIPARDAMPR